MLFLVNLYIYIWGNEEAAVGRVAELLLWQNKRKIAPPVFPQWPETITVLYIRVLLCTGRNGCSSSRFLLCREHECYVTTVSTFGQHKREEETTDGKNNRENKKKRPIFYMYSAPVVSPIRVYHYAGTRMPFSGRSLKSRTLKRLHSNWPGNVM